MAKRQVRRPDCVNRIGMSRMVAPIMVLMVVRMVVMDLFSGPRLDWVSFRISAEIYSESKLEARIRFTWWAMLPWSCRKLDIR